MSARAGLVNTQKTGTRRRGLVHPTRRGHLMTKKQKIWIRGIAPYPAKPVSADCLLGYREKEQHLSTHTAPSSTDE